MQRFKAILEPVPEGGHYVVVPPNVAEATGLTYRARVRGTLDGVAYRSSLMKYSGVYHLGVHKTTLAAANVKPGATVEISIEIDDKPLPTDSVPTDLQRALKASKRATTAWQALSPSHRREHVKHVMDAKKDDTRARRVAAAIEMLEKTPAKNAAPAAKRGAKAPNRSATKTVATKRR